MSTEDFRFAEVFSYESLVHAMAGAAGSVTAMTVFFPLDTARLRLQVDEKRKARSTPAILSEIVKEEGLLAPYRGWLPVICSLCCSNFVYFYCFHSLRASWLRGHKSTPSRDLLMGIAAELTSVAMECFEMLVMAHINNILPDTLDPLQFAYRPYRSTDDAVSITLPFPTWTKGTPMCVVNVLVTTPLWVVNTRLKLQGAKFRNADIRPTNYSGIMDAFVQIIEDEGVGALWNGTFPSLLLVLNPAVQFMIYEGLKRQLRSLVHRELLSLEIFLFGAIAKAVATTFTYPLQTVQSILRFGQHKQHTDRSPLLNSLRSVMYLLINRVRKYGMLGLFKGLEAKLLQTVLTAALMFLLYEKIASSIFRVMGVKRPASSH